MRAFLYSQDENMWNVVENGWEYPTKSEESKKVEGSSARILKPRKEWTEEEVRNINCDFKARNSLFTALSKKERMRISHCDTAKEAWDLLQVTYEGNKKVRGQKLQRLVLEFENMTMEEDELVDDFHARLLNVTSQCRSLDDPFEEHRIVKKFLRALPSKFQAKQIAIEEAQDLDTYTLDELVGNLKTFEMRLKPEKKVKSVAFSSIKKKEVIDDSVDLALLTKEFKNFLKNKNSSGTSKKLSNSKRDQMSENRFDKNPKYNLRGNKALKSTWSDSDDNTQSDGEEVNLALTSSFNSELSDVSDLEDDFFDEETNEKCKQLYNASRIVLKKNNKLKEEIEFLRNERTDLVDKIKVLQGKSKSQDWNKEHEELINKIKVLQEELLRVKESFNKFSIGSEKVSKMMGIGKAYGNKEGLGYNGESCKPLIFVKSVEGESSSSNSQSSSDKPSGSKLAERTEPHKVIHSHQKNLSVSSDKRTSVRQPSSSNEFEHVEATCLVALTALADKKGDVWYIDSDCSRHMTGEKSWFVSFSSEFTSGLVTFGDGKKATVMGKGTTCLKAKTSNDVLELWHRRLGHVNFQDLLKLSHKESVRGMPSLSGKPDKMCDGFKAVDNFSRFTWVNFLGEKSDTFESFKGLCKRITNEKHSSNLCIVRVRTDNGTEFKNALFADFFLEHGISHEFSAPITPQQNGVVERKNRVLLDMGRVMLHSAGLTPNLWAEAISTACYTANRAFLRPDTTKTPYELWKGKKPNVSHLRVFGSPCYIYRDREYLGEFDARSDKSIFLGYSLDSRAYRVYNKQIWSVMESYNVSIDDCAVSTVQVNLDEDQPSGSRVNVELNEETDDSSNDPIFDPPPVQRTGQAASQVSIDSALVCFLTENEVNINIISNCGFVSLIEPKNVKEALNDDDWINAMHDELNQFTRNDVWYLVPRPSEFNVIGTKWIFRNKSDEHGNVTRNKARLVAQGYT
ncbi:uncharacterized protein LOC133718229 [Rosa rugosa]|uniref:uncharacterized protein LOC133718229 n=1 Tax=Rosa rugosa TaxID=74645 RepID=UPI002B41779F|nr:uncharacterized protein LOC133718229 [Rosa rugosa]